MRNRLALMTRREVRSIREGYPRAIRKCWRVLTRRIRPAGTHKPDSNPAPVDKAAERRESKWRAGAAGMRSKWTLIPVTIIIVLAAVLSGRNAIQTWIDWNYRTENPHADLVPDSADLMITIDLARLRDPHVIDALNGW